MTRLRNPMKWYGRVIPTCRDEWHEVERYPARRTPPPHTHTQTQTQRETELEGKKTTPADACYVAG